MKSIIKFILSTRTMGILLVLYALTMAVATFVENDYGTPVAKALIYNATWFEIIMLLLILNFIGNIKRYNLFSKKKMPLFMFHISFIFLFLGGAITRYISYEGTMHIREGATSNKVTSEAPHIITRISDETESRDYKPKPFILTSDNIPLYLKPFQKKFKSKYDFKGQIVELKVKKYIPRAIDFLILDNSAKPILHVITDGRKDVYIESGNIQQVGNNWIGFNSKNPNVIDIFQSEESNNKLKIQSPIKGTYMIMSTQEQITVDSLNIQDFYGGSLYQFPGTEFVVSSLPVNGRIAYYEGDLKNNANNDDIVIMETKVGDVTKDVSFKNKKGMSGFQAQFFVNNLMISVGYGSIEYETPFALKLNKFEMERYPGSNSPSSYASEVSIIDEGKETPYRIYMNNILNYKGYRFFQASLDRDEKGTILSVNHDFWGTNITYTGYALLFLGMFLTLFWKGTHFWDLNKKLKDISKKNVATISLLLCSIFAFSQNDSAKTNQNKTQTPASTHFKNITDPAELVASIKIPKEVSNKFGQILVQSTEGRIEPINTLALNILRKIYKKDNFYGLDANQWFLAISILPQNWMEIPFIKLGKKGGEELLKKAKANKEGFTSLINLFSNNNDGSSMFIFADDFKKAFSKRAAEQNNYDKEVIDINEKIQIIQGIFNAQYLRIIPLQNEANNTWTSWMTPDFKINEIAYPLMKNYFGAIIEAQKNNDWNKADIALKELQDYQHKWGAKVIPSETKVKWEIRYNNWNIFYKIMIFYAIFGTILLLIAFSKLFTEKIKILTKIEYTLLTIICIGFIIHGIGLGLRWYISGHEPWSNGYEAVIFISWIAVLSGFMLYKNKNGFIPAAGCLVAVILMGFAHGGSQLNPQITPLVPLLKSYWLMIHVAIITASYGFLGLSALIGFVVLIFFIIDNEKIHKKVNTSTKELTIVNELSLTIGLFLLTVGTFLGGIWANESWGRYWSWDPKETWAFISVIIYAFVLHVRLIPKMRGKYIFNLLSLLSFSAIVMTYFGVNYYLSGLHSYAQGAPVPIPSWVYVTLATIAIISIISYIRYRKNKIKK